VGKVNYFWGGKSLVLGWDSRWGTSMKVTAAGSSTTGTYRPYGLDCSGFVDWVFYNVSGGAYIVGHTRACAVGKDEMDAYRQQLRANIGYDAFTRERPWDAGQLDEMVELMVEAVCSRRKTLRVSGNDFPQEVVKSRLLKLNGEHIRFVFDCLQKNTTQVRNVKQYLLAVLYNAPATMESYYAAQVSHDLYFEIGICLSPVYIWML
jgi:hypothetical protein